MFNQIKNLFSQRKGLTTDSEIVLRDDMSKDVENAILSCYYKFNELLRKYNNYHSMPKLIEQELWCHFFNRNIRDFFDEYSYKYVFETFFESDNLWYKKIDMLEYVCRWLPTQMQTNFGYDSNGLKLIDFFEKSLNFEFERLNYGYRIVNHMVTDVTSEEELKSIEMAIEESKDNVKEHLDKAIENYSKRPDPDCRNSIKESITAVEAVCRQLTGADDLNKALKQLNEKGIPIHERFKDGIRSFYNFTNQEDTGIRHALMKEGYTPSKAEAYFMLVSCSAFINYLRMISAK